MDEISQELSDEEAESYTGRVYYMYISHHAIVRPEKKSTPIRIVSTRRLYIRGSH